MSCIKKVTIDFDAKERTPFEKALFLARIMHICRIAKCRIALSKKGLHVYIDLRLPLWARIVLRSYLLDDPMRLEIDIKREEYGWCLPQETLFNAKCQEDYCYSETEVKIEELDRILFKHFSPAYA